MSIAHWDDDPTDWDRLVLGGNLMPGVWDIDFPSTRNMDVKKAKGKDGARFKDEGYDPARIELIGKLTSRDHFKELARILSDIHPKKKGAARAVLGIDHPKARLLGIVSVYVIELRSPKLERGLMTMTIRALEYVDKPATVKPRKPGTATLESELRDQGIMSIPPGPDAISKGP